MEGDLDSDGLEIPEMTRLLKQDTRQENPCRVRPWAPLVIAMSILLLSTPVNAFGDKKVSNGESKAFAASIMKSLKDAKSAAPLDLAPTGDEVERLAAEECKAVKLLNPKLPKRKQMDACMSGRSRHARWAERHRSQSVDQWARFRAHAAQLAVDWQDAEVVKHWFGCQAPGKREKRLRRAKIHVPEQCDFVFVFRSGSREFEVEMSTALRAPSRWTAWKYRLQFQQFRDVPGNHEWNPVPRFQAGK